MSGPHIWQRNIVESLVIGLFQRFCINGDAHTAKAALLTMDTDIAIYVRRTDGNPLTATPPWHAHFFWYFRIDAFDLKKNR